VAKAGKTGKGGGARASQPGNVAWHGCVAPVPGPLVIATDAALDSTRAARAFLATSGHWAAEAYIYSAGAGGPHRVAVSELGAVYLALSDILRDRDRRRHRDRDRDRHRDRDRTRGRDADSAADSEAGFDAGSDHIRNRGGDPDEPFQAVVHVDSAEALKWLNRWRQGSEELPDGYPRLRRRGNPSTLVLLQRLVPLHPALEFRHVRAHVGDPLNEGADSLARLALRVSRGVVDAAAVRELPARWAAARLAERRAAS
jgi:hypothetical protein